MRKPRAIICDDDYQILDLFRSVLEEMGYEVLTAETPVTCAFYRDHADSCPQHHRCADILITDYSMPCMTGLELLEMQHQRGCKLTSKNKALITGSEDSELRKKTAELGCHIFPKPLIIPALIAWLQECEKRFNLSEPLASELYQPQRKRTLVAK
jgi:CheY-like chemotaxis protein